MNGGNQMRSQCDDRVTGGVTLRHSRFLWLAILVAFAALLCLGLRSAAANQLVNQDTPPPGGRVQNSSGIVLDGPSGNLVVAYNDDPAAFNGIGTSFRPVAAGLWQDSFTQVPPVFQWNLDASVTSDQLGFVYAGMASYDNLPASNSGIYVSASMDGGVNFGPANQVTLWSGAPGAMPFVIKPKIEADAFPGSPFNRNVYVVYEEDGPNLINSNAMFSSSPPGGAAWTPPVVVNDNIGQDHVLWPDLGVASTGTVHTAWLESAYGQIQGFQGRIMTDASVNAGMAWGPDVMASQFWTVPSMLRDAIGAPTYMATSYPSIQPDPSQPNRVCMAYAARPGGGLTFETRLDTGDVPPGSADAGLPYPFSGGKRVVASNGWVHTVWDDLRAGTELYYQRTASATPTWPGPEVLLSTGLLPTAHSAVVLPTVEATGSRVYAAWTEPYVDISNWVYVVASGNDGLNWGAPIALDSSNAPANHARIACSGSNVCVSWESPTNPTVESFIRVNYSTNGGATWAGEVTVTAPNTYCYNHDIFMLGSNVYLVWAQGVAASTSSHIYTSFSTNGGASWSSPVRIDSNPIGALPAFAPKVCAAGGNVYALWVDQRRTVKDIYFAYSNTSGVFWSADTPLNPAVGPSNCHFPQIACNGTSVYAVYEDSGDVYANVSTNSGVTWQGQARLNTGIAAGSGGSSYVRVAVSGPNVYTTWQDSRRGGWDIYGTHSSNSGLSWPSSDYRIDLGSPPGAANSWHPHVAADGNGSFYQWSDERAGTGLRDVYANAIVLSADEADIFYTESNDGGLTWSVPIRVNDDATTNDQSHPWLDVKPTGVVDVFWKDKRLDVNDRNYDTYFASLLPGAAAFQPNVRVTTQTLLPPPSMWVGDYCGIEVDALQAHCTWTDTRVVADVGAGDIFYDAIPNPLFGACCVSPGTCALLPPADCTGDYMGDGVPCEPNPCVVLPDYEDHDVGDCVFTVTDQGALGFMDVTQTEGSGFVYPSTGTNQLFIGSLWVGLDPTYTANRDFDPDPEKEWVVSTSPDGHCMVYEPGISDQDIHVGYTDAGASVPRGLYVEQHSWAWGAPDPADDFVILNYSIHNESGAVMTDLYAGVYLDLDIGASFDDDEGVADPSLRLTYLFDTSGLHVGVLALDETLPLANVTLVHNPTYVWPNQFILDPDKYAFLSAADPGHVMLASPLPDDYSVLASMGPFELGPGEVRTVSFAVIGGESLEHFMENVTVAWMAAEGDVSDVPDDGVKVTVNRLLPNAPNPFSDETVIRFELVEDQLVSLTVYDVSGRRVRNLLNEVVAGGRQFVRWDGRDQAGRRVAEGVYFIKLVVPDRTLSRPIVVIR